MSIKDSIPINQIINIDNREGLRSLPSNCIPLTVTSPPWDDIRIYGDGSCAAWNNEVFRQVADELWRVTAPGGVVCWHVGEQMVNGSESGTSSEQRIYFRDLGFSLWRTLVIDTVAGQSHSNRYGLPVQFVFVISKGRPSVVNLLKDRANKTAGKIAGFYKRRTDGIVEFQRHAVVADFSVRGSVWRYNPRKQNDEEAQLHPAPMDEAIVRDLILSFSDPGDLVLDVFAGSGTTPKQAMLLGRHYLGFEAVADYCQLARKRVDRYLRHTADTLNPCLETTSTKCAQSPELMS